MGRDDISKLPMPQSGKRYARRHGKDILHNFSQYAKAVADVTNAPEFDQRVKDVGVVLRTREAMPAKHLLKVLNEHDDNPDLRDDDDSTTELTLGGFLEKYPYLAQALSYAWGARHAKKSWDSEKVVGLKFPEAAMAKAEQYAQDLGPAALENVATDIESAELLNLTDRPGFDEFDKIMHDLYSALVES